ncbi:hypothetical protein [Massilia sp. CF038]|uniref:hypothetical protein n=1 Tax=Massilia sp. CF038 TaxID=1881045 RepID=UPI000911AD89|nr:hypothetical protein [Massilia sp. CF038]SHH18647.1 hypothetical protein SAMN05428948_3210 [Massilia sp. CF038]
MSEYLLEPETQETLDRPVHQPRPREPQEALILSELAPDTVFDHLDDDGPVDLITFGAVRELCPACRQSHLKLVLRQRRVRLAHLFCADCLRCYDAHYPNGSAALTI